MPLYRTTETGHDLIKFKPYRQRGTPTKLSKYLCHHYSEPSDVFRYPKENTPGGSGSLHEHTPTANLDALQKLRG